MLAISVNHYLVLSVLLFGIGTIGVLVRRNALVVFMSIELMLNAVNLAFVTFSRQFDNVDGQIFVFMVITVAAAEAAVGLAIVINVFKLLKNINVDQVRSLQG